MQMKLNSFKTSPFTWTKWGSQWLEHGPYNGQSVFEDQWPIWNTSRWAAWPACDFLAKGTCLIKKVKSNRNIISYQVVSTHKSKVNKIKITG